MRVLLVQPFKDTGVGGESYPPVGLGYLASSLRESGHSVKIIDCLKDIKSYKKFIEAAKEFSAELIGFTLFSISIPFVNKMVDLVKGDLPAAIIVLGGPHVSSLPNKILDYFKKVDFAIRGEGEVPLRLLADAIESGKKNFQDIPGLIYRKNGAILMNEPYFAKNIEEYGFPAWDLINPPAYFKYVCMVNNAVAVFFSRGCPFPCTFCAAKVTSGQALRRRGIEHIFKELHFLKEKYNVKRFIIEDDGFAVTKKFIMDFCARIKEENFKAYFSLGVGMRLDIVDEELLGAMKKSNFDKTIALGIESGSERILGLMKKKTNLALIKEKVNLMNKMGFEPTGYFILGYPDETRQEMEETIKLALRLPIREVSFTAFQPLPGTEATKMLLENKELPEDFDFAALAPDKITYAPREMSHRELESIRKRAILRFYLKPINFMRYLRSASHFIYAFRKLISIFFRANVID